MIQTYCLKCGRLLRLPDSAIDKVVRCPACGASVQAPGRGTAKGAGGKAADMSPAEQAWTPEAAVEPPVGALSAEAQADGEKTMDPAEMQPTGDPSDAPEVDTDIEQAPPLAPVDTPVDMQFVWKLTWAAVGVVLLATLIIVGASFFHGPSWEEGHRDQMMALMNRAEEEAGDPNVAYSTYKELDKLVGDHKIQDPILAAKLAAARVQRDHMFERVMAANNTPPPQQPVETTSNNNDHRGPGQLTTGATTRGSGQETAELFPTIRPKVSRPATQPILTDDEVGRSISKGADFLISLWGTDGLIGEHINYDYQGHRQGVDALAVYTLLQAGHAIHDDRLTLRSPFMRSALEALKKLKFDETNDQTYCRSLRLQALALAGRKEDEDQLKIDLRWLLEAGRTGSYTYGLHDPRQSDNSNSQYGLLGVWAAAEDDQTVPLNSWRAVQQHWDSSQRDGGQWAYQNENPTGSMTAAGVAALFVVHDFLDPVDLNDAVGRPPFTPQLSKGLAWLENDDHCMFNRVGNEGRYALYGLERVGLISGYKFFGTHDWFRELGKDVISYQMSYGPWNGDPIETSFAMLFLSRGRHPIMINKLRFDGTNGDPGFWANRPRDAANLARYTSRILERPFSWQVVPLKADWTAWTDAPVLYLASHEPPPFTAADEEKLRRYVMAGGLLVTQADADSPSFNDWAEKLGPRLFGLPWTNLQPNDLLFTVGQPVKDPPPVRAIRNGARLLYVHLPRDISKYWQARDDLHHRNDFDLGVDLFVYASGQTDFHNRLVTTYVPPTPGKPSGSIKLAELTAITDNPEPAAWPRFGQWLRAQTNLGLRIIPTSLETLKFATAPIAHFTGISHWAVTDGQARALREYVESGGIVLIDPCGGPNAFDQTVRQELLPRAFPSAPLSAFGEDHPLLNATSDGMVNLGTPLVRNFIHTLNPRPSVDFEMLRSGRGCVIVSPLDITSGLLGTSTWGIAGFDPAYCTAFAKNWVIWAWDGGKD